MIRDWCFNTIPDTLFEFYPGKRTLQPLLILQHLKMLHTNCKAGHHCYTLRLLTSNKLRSTSQPLLILKTCCTETAKRVITVIHCVY